MFLSVDFGTCNTSAALAFDGKIRLLKEPLKHGYSFPSSVYLTEEGEMLVGQAAEHNRMQNLHRYRREFKRDLGINNPYLIGERSISPQEVVTEILKKLKNEAAKITTALSKEKITDVVITVPATYQLYKRNLMQKAAQAAGFNSVKLVEEPVAASIYYAHQNITQLQEEEIILVYDLGGGSFDVTLVKRQGNGYQILSAPMGLDDCGGIEFDRLIYEDIKNRCSEVLAQQLEEKSAWRDRAKVYEQCTQIKHQLSEAQKATVSIPPTWENYQLSRVSFNKMIAPLVNETVAICNQLIQTAGIDWKDINRVLLVGGSCRIASIRNSLEEIIGYPPLLMDDPELAICQGAAIYGTNLNSKSIKGEGKKHKEVEPNLKTSSNPASNFSGDPFDAFGEKAVSQNNDSTSVDDWF